MDMARTVEEVIAAAREELQRRAALWHSGEVGDVDSDELFADLRARRDEAMAEPPAAATPGPAGLRVTYDWLHAAYEDLHWTIHNIVAEGDWVVVHTTMSGRQVGPFVTYAPDGQIGQVFPATGRTFAATQTHWYRVADGQLIEHHANRDDMGQAMQLGWMQPPSEPSA